ncbi:MAG: class I SAM-dependent methyltransferase, partial [Bacteroidota bacterium]
LIHFKQHFAFFQKSKPEDESAIFELGTGWYPVIPVAFFLNGVDYITTVDVSGFLSKERVMTTMKKYLYYWHSGQLMDWISYTETQMLDLKKLYERKEQLNLEQLLSGLNIIYNVGDAAQIKLSKRAFDLVISNNTFEHVYPDELYRLLARFKDILKPNGAMVHFIDMSDHFAHLDKSITIYNFLQFSDGAWKWIDNSVQPQNRWRIDDYRKLYQELEIPITEEINRPGNQAEVEYLVLADRFKEKSLMDLAISHSYIYSRIG